MERIDLTSLFMLQDLSELEVDELEDAIEVVLKEIVNLKSELNEAHSTQTYYLNNMTNAKDNNNEGELTFNYNKLMQEEKEVFEIESAIDDCERLLNDLRTTIEDKSVEMPKPRM